MAIATVPAVVPRPKMKVAIRAVTKVGKVLATEKRSLTAIISTLLFTMLEEASMAIGIATRAPTILPMMLILMVSKRGVQMDGM